MTFFVQIAQGRHWVLPGRQFSNLSEALSFMDKHRVARVVRSDGLQAAVRNRLSRWRLLSFGGLPVS
jgi:hypothetical protein